MKAYSRAVCGGDNPRLREECILASGHLMLSSEYDGFNGFRVYSSFT